MINPVFWFNAPLLVEVASTARLFRDDRIAFFVPFQAQTTTTIVYSLTIESPLTGWEGFFIQVNFPGLLDSVLELTTETQIIPDTYPTGDCHDQGCAGTLV